MANLQFPTLNEQKVANIWNGDQALAVEGNYFVVTNPTPGTGIATTTSITTETQVSPVLTIGNMDKAGDITQQNVYLRYIKMIVTAVPTSATAWDCSMRFSSGPNNYTSGGTTVLPVNVNSATGIVSSTKIVFGAIVTLASNGALVQRAKIDTAIPVVGDTWIFTFGDGSMPASMLNGGTTAKTSVIPCAPLIVGPGQWLNMFMWGASNGAAPAWEFEIGYVER